jgi:phosphonate transport system substrate-binding protein
MFALRLAVVFNAVSVLAQEQPKDFTFTAIPDEDTARLQQRFGKVAQDLSDTVGTEVNYIPVKSYSASVAAFKNNDVQLAWLGGLSGVQARFGVPGAMAIAQGEADPEFISYFIAHSSTGLMPSKDFRKALSAQRLPSPRRGLCRYHTCISTQSLSLNGRQNHQV